MDTLAELVLNSQKMMEFQNFLYEEFGYGARTVFDIIEGMIANADIKKALGSKILCVWLKYKIFAVLKFLKSAQKAKREKISNYFLTTSTEKSTFSTFIKDIYVLID